MVEKNVEKNASHGPRDVVEVPGTASGKKRWKRNRKGTDGSVVTTGGGAAPSQGRPTSASVGQEASVKASLGPTLQDGVQDQEEGVPGRQEARGYPSLRE